MDDAWLPRRSGSYDYRAVSAGPERRSGPDDSSGHEHERVMNTPARVRLLACDLDGTLLTRRKRISPRTREALDAAAARGVAVILATGRSFPVARFFCGDLMLVAPQITFNGAVIYDPRAERALSEYLIPPQHLPAALDFYVDEGIPIGFYAPDGLYLDAHMPDPPSWFPGSASIGTLVDDVRTLGERPCIKIVGHGDPYTIAELRPRAVERLGHHLYVTQTAATLLEVLHPEVSKGAALRRIAHLLGVDRTEVVAFGDNHNDLDMLEFAGIGVAMGNATAEAKAVADMVTAGNEEDGIAVALERLGVI